jgi:hypothetical protein
MSGSPLNRFLRHSLVSMLALAAASGVAGQPGAPEAEAGGASLEDQFRDPPAEARPRVWWHWMNGNITKDGIARDLDWMKRVGIGGLQNFDVGISTPQVVDKRLVYMTPEWKDAFRFAATEADRLGLELAIAASPGWSETGGPWVPAEDGLKKLVWSETEVEGGRRFTGRLPSPPAITGPFQSIRKPPGVDELIGSEGAPKPVSRPELYADTKVLAFPVAGAGATAPSEVIGQDGKPIDGAVLIDDDLESAIEVKPGGGAPAAITYVYPQAQTIRSATLFMPGAAALFVGATVLPTLEASDDGTNWRKIAELPAATVPTTVSFAPVSATRFRLVFVSNPGGGLPMMSAPAQGIDPSGLLSRYASRGAAGMKLGDFRLHGDARIDRYEAKAGFDIKTDYYALSAGVPEERGIAPDRVIDLTDRMKPDGTLAWTPPKGRWRVVRLGWSLLGTTNHPAAPEATGLEVDKYDGPAVRRYLKHYIGMYRDAAGPELVGQRGVRAILTDSIEVGAANWTPRMIEQFRRLRGYDPTPWLPALTGAIVGSRAQSDRFLYDYRRTLADLMSSEHYGTVAKVAHEAGLKVYGEALESGRPSLGDDISMRRHTDVPMAAMWTHSVKEGPRPSHVVDVRGAASVAHIYGKKQVAAEALTSFMAPWDHGPAYLRRVIDLAFVNGLNLPVIHTSVHQPLNDKVPGLSLFVFGQYFNRHDSWAELAKPWVDYMARNSFMLQQGRNVADVGYFYGEEAPLTGLYGETPITDAPKRHAYDFVNAEALMDALANEGGELVTPGGARYRALYLGGSSRRMTVPALRRLAQLVEGGATVIGKAPQDSPALTDDAAEHRQLVARLWPGGEAARIGQGRVVASGDVEAALAGLGVKPQFHFSGGQADSEIPFVHRRLADGDSFFLVNRKDRAETIEARFRVTGKAPEIWRAQTGTAEPAGYRIENGETIVRLTLAPFDSLHVVFRRPAESDALTIAPQALAERGRIEGPWRVSFQPGRGAPASAEFPRLAPLQENADARIRYFSGIATYSANFNAPRGWKAGDPLWLDLGAAHEVAEVTVNGKAAGSVWTAPYKVDIGNVAQPGANRLEIRVANLWSNRLIGDAQPGAEKIGWTTLPTYLKSAPLRPSGLIGPVTLQGE